jgi:protein involved in polysaccharide export with SLBB domain
MKLFANKFFLFLVILFSIHWVQVNAQFDNINLATVNVDDLSDDQIQKIKDKIATSGYTTSQIEKMAKARGMSDIQYSKLQTRLLSTGDKTVAAVSDNQAPVVVDRGTPSNVTPKVTTAGGGEAYRPKIFGTNLFTSENLTFEPSTNIPTPRDYQLGVGDQVSIDIWGVSQANYLLKVNTEGYINIPLVGPVFINGLTIEKASGVIIGRLKSIYAGLGQNTFALVNLASIRTIKVTIMGEVQTPGTYSISSLATVFNALYVSGGPSFSGSFRDIKVVRKSKTIANIDVYDFLMSGNQTHNIRLEDQDVIYVNPYKCRVDISGEVKRGGIYELKGKESLAKLIDYAGGFTERAYTYRLKVYRNSDRERQIIDVEKADFANFYPETGDKIEVEPILDRFENMVEIKGAVWRPGKFSINDSSSLMKLIDKAEGFRGDAYMQRAVIFRTRDNFKVETIPVNLEMIKDGKSSDIPLAKDDQVQIYSIYDFEDVYNVTVQGEVRNPVNIPLSENLTLEDALAQAGGFTPAAIYSKIEVARRVVDIQKMQRDSTMAELIYFDVDKDLNVVNGSGFMLKPFDIITVRRSPNYEDQKQIQIFGEVNFPGSYILTNKAERLSSVIKRAGGLSIFAYSQGAKLIRKFNMTEVERNIQRSNGVPDSLIEINKEREQTIGIDLKKAMENPGSKYDILVEYGDKLIISRELQTVGVNGAVLYPLQVSYYKSYSFKDYISQSGGFADNAVKRQSFVIYANGNVKRTKHFLGLKFYPTIEPGSEIVVPRQAKEETKSISERIAITSALATMSLVIVSIVNAVK